MFHGIVDAERSRNLMAKKQATDRLVLLHSQVLKYMRAQRWIEEDVSEYMHTDLRTVHQFVLQGTASETTVKMFERFLRRRAMFA